MADGYEPTSAVPPQTQAALAQFGSPNPVAAQSNLGFAELQQRKQESAQNAQERLYDRQMRAQELGMQQNQFQQGMNLQQQQFGLEQQRAKDEMSRFTQGQDLQERLQKRSEDFQMNLMKENQRIADERQDP
jgi:hypothetical protein